MVVIGWIYGWVESVRCVDVPSETPEISPENPRLPSDC
jgi:hypothetical protein